MDYADISNESAIVAHIHILLIISHSVVHILLKPAPHWLPAVNQRHSLRHSRDLPRAFLEPLIVDGDPAVRSPYRYPKPDRHRAVGHRCLAAPLDLVDQGLPHRRRTAFQRSATSPRSDTSWVPWCPLLGHQWGTPPLPWHPITIQHQNVTNKNIHKKHRTSSSSTMIINSILINLNQPT